MSLLLPSPSNGYAVTVNFKISDAVWNAAIPHLAGRVEELEDIVAAGYTAAQEAGTAMAEAIIQDAVAPQIADITETIAGFQTSLALAEDQLAALQNGGVEAVNVPLAPYGLFGPGTDAQEAFALTSDYLQSIYSGIDNSPVFSFSFGDQLALTFATEAQAKAGTNIVFPVNALGVAQHVVERRNKVGEVIFSKASPGPEYLLAKRGVYLKSAYPALAAALGSLPNKSVIPNMPVFVGGSSASDTIAICRSGSRFIVTGAGSGAQKYSDDNGVTWLSGTGNGGPATDVDVDGTLIAWWYRAGYAAFFSTDNGLTTSIDRFAGWTSSGTMIAALYNGAFYFGSTNVNGVRRSTDLSTQAAVAGFPSVAPRKFMRHAGNLFVSFNSTGGIWRVNASGVVANVTPAGMVQATHMEAAGDKLIVTGTHADGRPRAWVSTNSGGVWQEYVLPGTGTLTAFFAPRDGLYLLYNNSGTLPYFFVSEDIQNWEACDIFGSLTSAVTALVDVGGVLLAINPSDGRMAISRDGKQWSTLRMGGGSPLPNTLSNDNLRVSGNFLFGPGLDGNVLLHQFITYNTATEFALPDIPDLHGGLKPYIRHS